MLTRRQALPWLIALMWGSVPLFGASPGSPSSPVRLTVEPGHPWTPPFGLERVGRALEAVVENPAGARPTAEYVVVSYRAGKEVGRQTVKFAELSNPRFRFGRVVLQHEPTEVVLLTRSEVGAPLVERARAPVKPPPFEAEAVARPVTLIHPVDLGTIFVPAHWLLLAGGQKAEIEVAALSRREDLARVSVSVWYQSTPRQKVKSALALSPGHKVQVKLNLGPCSTTLKQDTLHVVLTDSKGRDLWRKDIPVMLVPEVPSWPRFGAVETKLRYDAPIPSATGKKIDYEQGWDPERKDVVVFFPNGARWVCWRGSSYCPFWAGRSNTGFCYEWAEILSGKHMTGQHDCVEPLQDKELRYGRVAIVESTPARVHLRWSYQSCDLDYKVWGDYAVEDYYFYPDGLGTRVMTLTAHPGVSVETNEFIIFTPQSGYPLEYLPANALDILGPQEKAEFRFPILKGEQEEPWAKVQKMGKDVPLLHRIRFGKDDRLAAIHYSPWGSFHDLPGFPPFYDRGTLVTPAYWGCHWPLSRGYPTGWSISDRIHETPGHNSLIHAGTPQALRSETGSFRDAQGRTTTLTRDVWVWLIGMTDAGDEELRQSAQSFGHPPKLEAQGATMGPALSAPERRALCLTVQNKKVTIAITPVGHCLNPVFELKGAPKVLRAVQLNQRALEKNQYRWDGATLWVGAHLHQPATLELEFGDGK